jgi:hypothetical protein
MHLPGHAKADPKDWVGAHIGTSSIEAFLYRELTVN